MRRISAFALLALSCLLGCSQNMMMGQGCPEGTVACQSSCVPQGAVCGGPDAGVNAPKLSDLSVSNGALSPAFSPDTMVYTAEVSLWVREVQVTATAADPGATLLINGTQVASGTPSAPISIGPGPTPTMIAVVVQTQADGERRYDVVIAAPIDYIKASNTASGDNFAYSVSVSGDTLAVGTPGEDSSATGVNGSQSSNGTFQSGAVYIFTRSGNVWTQQAYLKASNTGSLDDFGHRVSLSGDTLAVAAPGEGSSAVGEGGNQTDNGAAESGAVYIFQRTGTTWAQQAYLKASNTQANDHFGHSVSVSGDTVAVGAPDEDSNATGEGGNQIDNSQLSSGAVYVFQRTGTTWAQQAYLKASNTQSIDYFGWSVSVSGDTLAVGGYQEDSNATGEGGNQGDNTASNSGAVYVFQRTGTTWAQQAYLKPSNTDGGELFGSSVSLFGDTLAVGARGETSNATGVNGNQADNSASGAGAAYVFQRTGATWAQQAYIKASNTGESDSFGWMLSLSGDKLVVSGHFEDSSAKGVNGNQADNTRLSSGAAYVFQRTGTTWAQQAYLKASNSDAYELFGYSVSISGDTVVVGAPEEDGSSTGVNGDQTTKNFSVAGAAYIFR